MTCADVAVATHFVALHSRLLEDIKWAFARNVSNRVFVSHQGLVEEDGAPKAG